MDIIKIGQFLASLRRAHNLTQEQLGEQLGVTGKTISRWENGNYMPPVDALLTMSELYGIGINEILSGRQLSEEEFKAEAEKNVTEALKESAFTLPDRITFFRRKWKKEHMLSLVLGILVLLVLLLAGLFWKKELLIPLLPLFFVWYIIRYNRMMAYIETHAYGKKKGNT